SSAAALEASTDPAIQPKIRTGVSRRSLVKRNRRVDGTGPGIDASDEVVHALEALLFEEQRDLHAAPAVMADRHHFLLVVDLADSCRKLAHRDERGTRHARLVELPRLAHVEQHRLLATLIAEPGGELCRSDRVHVRSESAAAARRSRAAAGPSRTGPRYAWRPAQCR